MKSVRLLIFTLPILLFATRIFAQQTIKSEEVDVVKAYQPLLADAVKIQQHAEPAALDTTMQPLQYDVKQHVINVPFSPAEIRPVALPLEPPKPLLNNLVKIGFGTQLTPLVDLFLSSGRSDKFSYGLNFHHISSNPSNVDFQDISHTGGSVFGRSYFKSTELSGELSYDRDLHYFYGFDPGQKDSINNFTKDFLKQKFQTIGANVGLKNSKETKADIDYNFNFGFNDFERKAGDSTVKDASENNFRFEMGLAKTIQKIHSAHLDFYFQKENFKSVFDTSLNYISILPNYQFHNKKIDLKVGVNIDVVNKVVKLYPEVSASYKLIADYLIPYVGFHGGASPNTMQQTVAVNPFIGNFSPFTVESNEVFLGMKGSYANNLTYNLRVQYTNQKNTVFYLPDGEMPAHYIAFPYAEASIMGAHAEVGYKQSERLNLLLSGEVNSYNLDYSDEPLGVPKSKLSFTANYNLQNKIFFNVDVFAQSGAFTIIPGDTVSTQQKGVVDLNFSTTYNYKKNIAIWFSINNIASVKEREWYNYPYYGFQALAGVILKF